MISRTAEDIVFASNVASEVGETMKGHRHSESSAALANGAELSPEQMRGIRLQDMYTKSLVHGLVNSADLHTKHLETVVVDKLQSEAGVRTNPTTYSMLKLKQINMSEQLKPHG
jgi:hypothetical protein